MNDLNIFLLEVLADFSGYIKYKLLNTKYSWGIPRSIYFETEFDKRTGTYLISARDYQGLYTIASNEEEIIALVNDAIFTYFGVPRFVAKRLPNIFNPEGKGESYQFVNNDSVVLA